MDLGCFRILVLVTIPLNCVQTFSDRWCSGEESQQLHPELYTTIFSSQSLPICLPNCSLHPTWQQSMQAPQSPAEHIETVKGHLPSSFFVESSLNPTHQFSPTTGKRYTGILPQLQLLDCVQMETQCSYQSSMSRNSNLGRGLGQQQDSQDRYPFREWKCLVDPGCCTQVISFSSILSSQQSSEVGQAKCM